jgi:putative ABC transport system permease protein
MQTILQDVRYALRLMWRNKFITIIAVCTLAIGIGANTSIFSVVYGVLLHPLPYPGSERLVAVLERQPKMTLSVSYPDYEDMRGHVTSFESVAGGQRASFNLTGLGDAERVQGRWVSANFFSTFGVPIPMGRDFGPEDDREGAAPTAILSYAFWQNHFSGSRDVLGKVITLNDKQYTVIGVAPANFKYGEGIELYTPLTLAKTPMWGRGAHSGLVMIGRLKPGVTIDRARAEMNTLYHSVEAAHPGEGMPGRQASVTPLLDIFISDIQRPLWIMFAAVGFMLLIACSNVAMLLLARATARQREFAIRNALGASRAQIVRQLLTESVLLSFVGGVLGIFVSGWGLSLLRAAKPANLPRVEEIALDPWVLIFTAGLAVLTGILFGLIPALHGSKTSVNEVLKDAAVRGSSGRSGRSRNVLVAAEFGLALVLLIAAGLTIKSFVRLLAVNLGFEAQNLTTFQLSFPAQKYEPMQALHLLDRYRDEAAAIPQVQNVVYTNGAPLVGVVSQSFYRVQDNMRDLKAMHEAALTMTTPEFLDTMKITLQRGRFLTNDDRADTQKVVVIDEDLAKEVFPGQDPVGQQIKYPGDEKGTPNIMQIVGVVAHVKEYGLDDATPIKTQMYTPIVQAPGEYLADSVRQITVLVRSTSDTSALAHSMRAKLAQLDSTLPLYNVKTYEEVVKDETEVKRFTTALLAAFAGLALLLAAIGIYGVLSYAVEQRTREIGIRMALGASGAAVVRLIVAQAMRTIGMGLLAGIVAALALTRYMSAILYGVRSWDPVVFSGITALLALVALLASYIPARRATHVDPLTAVRYE